MLFLNVLLLSLSKIVIFVVYLLKNTEPGGWSTTSASGDEVDVLDFSTGLLVVYLFSSLKRKSCAFFDSGKIVKWLLEVIDRMQELASLSVGAVTFSVEHGADFSLKIAW